MAIWHLTTFCIISWRTRDKVVVVLSGKRKQSKRIWSLLLLLLHIVDLILMIKRPGLGAHRNWWKGGFPPATTRNWPTDGLDERSSPALAVDCIRTSLIFTRNKTSILCCWTDWCPSLFLYAGRSSSFKVAVHPTQKLLLLVDVYSARTRSSWRDLEASSRATNRVLSPKQILTGYRPILLAQMDGLDGQNQP